MTLVGDPLDFQHIWRSMLHGGPVGIGVLVPLEDLLNCVVVLAQRRI